MSEKLNNQICGGPARRPGKPVLDVSIEEVGDAKGAFLAAVKRAKAALAADQDFEAELSDPRHPQPAGSHQTNA